MFYRPENGHGLKHNPLNAIIAPRPIAWISTRAGDGSENLAPYSFFNAVAYEPPQLMFASTSAKADRILGKDTLSNIEETGVFCVNIVDFAHREAMNQSSRPFPRAVDEFAAAGVDRQECETIPCSRVSGVPASLECVLTQILRLAGQSNFAVFGEIKGIHLHPDCLRDGMFTLPPSGLLARMGYRGDYAVVREIFDMPRPAE